MIARSRPVYIGVPNREVNSMSDSTEVSGEVQSLLPIMRRRVLVVAREVEGRASSSRNRGVREELSCSS